MSSARVPPSAAEGGPSLTTEGARRFQCIGPDCELTCCSGWTVTVDPAHQAAIVQALSASSAGKRELKGAFGAVPNPKSEATLNLRPNGDCWFLGSSPDNDRLCTLQARFGEPIIPNTCAQYPRLLATVGGRKELFGFLSCPEMARQCLLHEDGMALCEGESHFSRPLDRRALPDPERPYHQPFEEIRAAGLQLLSQRQFPIATRLFLLAYLGKRTADFFHREAPTLDRPKLDAELARLRDPQILQQLHHGFRGLQVPVRVAAEVVLGVLRARPDKNLGPLVQQVFEGFVAEGLVERGDDAQVAAQANAIWESYVRRRSHWETALPHFTDLCFENYAKNYWLRDWYLRSPNLVVHVQTYLFQAAIARFLIYCHPALLGVEPSDAAFGKVVVEVISRVSRAVEHAAAFVQQVAQSFADQGMQDFPHTTILARA